MNEKDYTFQNIMSIGIAHQTDWHACAHHSRDDQNNDQNLKADCIKIGCDANAGNS